MKLISMDEVPRHGLLRVFRHRPWGSIIMLFIVLALPAVLGGV